jgi:hypothetical protein
LICSPIIENHEGNNSKTTGDISSNGDVMPPANKMPPVQSLENHAQKLDIGGIGGNGDISPTHIEEQQRKATEAGNENDKLPSSSRESNSIYRLGHSDTFACYNCRQTGDKWFMQKHLCIGGNDKLSL